MAITKIPSKKYGYTYQVDYRYKNDVGVVQRIIKSGFKTEKDAKTFLKKKKEEIALQELRKCNKTFDEVFKEYMEVEGVIKYANSSKIYYLETHKRYVKGKFGSTPITAIKYINLQKEFNNYANKYNYPTVKNIKKIFSVTFSFAIRAGYVRDNPAKLLQLPKNPIGKKVKVEVISDEDLTALMNKLQKISKHSPKREAIEFNSKAYAMALYIGRYTGLRVSEVLALKKEDFDLINCTMNVRRRVEYAGLKRSEIYLTEKLKSHDSKAVVEINRKFCENLKLWFEYNPNDLVICDRNGNLIHPETLNIMLREKSKELGIHFHFHMLRHTYATELMMAGVNPVVVKDLMRHSEVSITWNTYTHPESDEQRKALEKVYMEIK